MYLNVSGQDRHPRAGAHGGGSPGAVERGSANGSRAPEVPEGVCAASPTQVPPPDQTVSGPDQTGSDRITLDQTGSGPDQTGSH